MFWDIPVCSGMFRNVAECSMFLALSTTSGLALWFLNYMNEQMRRQLNAVLHGCYHLKVSNIAKTSCEPKPVVLRWQPMHTPVSGWHFTESPLHWHGTYPTYWSSSRRDLCVSACTLFTEVTFVLRRAGASRWGIFSPIKYTLAVITITIDFINNRSICSQAKYAVIYFTFRPTI